MLRRRQLSIVVIVVAVLLVVFYLVTSAPSNFPINKQMTIREGASTGEIASLLAEQGVIKSAFVFRVLLRFGGGEKNVQAGDYWFEAPLPAWRIVGRLGRGQFVLHPVKLTILEGSNPKQVEKAIFGKFPNLNDGKNKIADVSEIFPDTYFIPPQINFDKLLEITRKNFARQTASLRASALLTKRDWPSVVIMASIVEEEASDETDRRLIAGILWKRLDDKMLLQVDVAPETYKKLGLPAQAIVNPGLDALDAALHPTVSDYWYYLADKKGVTHYAETFAEHKANKLKYLK